MVSNFVGSNVEWLIVLLGNSGAVGDHCNKDLENYTQSHSIRKQAIQFCARVTCFADNIPESKHFLL